MPANALGWTKQSALTVKIWLGADRISSFSDYLSLEKVQVL